MEVTSDNIMKAKAYMYEYKARVEIHKVDIGFIGRFFEKLFGTNFYSDLEIYMRNTYKMSWIQAYEILLMSNNKLTSLYFISSSTFKWINRFFL